LTPVGQKRLAILVSVVPADTPGEDPARVQRQTIDRLYEADLVLVDFVTT